MFCQFCKIEIPPSWARVIASNSCPACGEAIISEENKKIMEDLKEAITKMSASPEELAGWLMSTYDLHPKGSVEPTNFHRKQVGNRMATQEPDGPPMKWANSPTAQFMKRAGADKVLNNPKLAAIAHAINNVNAIEGQMYGEQEVESGVDEDVEAEEQQQIVAMAARAKAQGRRFTMKEALANTTEFNMGGNAQPLSEAETEIMKHIIGGPEADNDMSDLQGLPPVLQADRLKRLAAQRELQFGGSAGLIKRSE